jgi:type I restriction enzyme S subunit
MATEMLKQPDSKVPEIRFKGFSENWEVNPIRKILSEIKRPITLKDNSQYELVTVKRRNGGIVSRGYLMGRDILVKNYSQLQTGDFLISKRQVVHGATGIVPEELNNAIVSNEYLVSIGNNEITTEFLTILASLPAMRQQFFLSSYGVDIEKLFFDAEDWKKRSVTIPSPTEQTEISGYFRELDRLIELHQRKHDKLVTLKKAMLQKMFPQPGATTPEIRFKGFEGKWAEEKLGKLGTLSKGRGYSKNDLLAFGTPIVLYGRLYLNYQTEISYVDTFVTEKNKSVKSIGKEVIIPASGETAEDIARASAILVEGIILGGDLNIIYPIKELDSCFLAITLSNGKPQTDLAKRAQGKTVAHVRKEDIKSISIYYPKLIEQQKISTYFRTLDELISKHAIQLQKLQQIKSACLEKMFV